jgi:methionyl-tRNA synthetase
MLLVTTALPYANGDIHLGHLLEHIQADIYVRNVRLRNSNGVYFCGADDFHGTAIMLAAEKQGIHPEILIEQSKRQHQADIEGFGVKYDNYYTTHSEENRGLVEAAYLTLKEKGLIEKRKVQQLFDPEKQMFLPDRFVKGECPKCHAQGQYGDNCEVCGTTYEAYELINPKSTVSEATPVLKEAEHLFLKVRSKWKFLKDSYYRSMTTGPVLRGPGKRILDWIGKDQNNLEDWCISRDAPYFGFNIPGEKDKYFYVWMDAPFGYFASYRNLCNMGKAKDFGFHKSEKDFEMIHFIGKDILRFHAIFWPVVLESCDMVLPNKIRIHGFVTVNGEKMSKSRGTYVTARKFLDSGINPEFLRYYFASKLAGASETDIDFDIDDFVEKVNSDIIGKLVNIPFRVGRILNRYFESEVLNSGIDTSDVYSRAGITDAVIADIYWHIRMGYYNKAVIRAMKVADMLNEYVEQFKPWEVKCPSCTEERRKNIHYQCSEVLVLFRGLMQALSPILPNLHKSYMEFLNIDETKNIGLQEMDFKDGHIINTYEHLAKRLDKKIVQALFE